jgi:hypothetical protein
MALCLLIHSCFLMGMSRTVLSGVSSDFRRFLKD